MTEKIYDVVILGGGPSGLTAAIYTSRAFLSTLVLAGNPPGGQLMLTTDVENYPGFPDGITGPELVMNMRQQALRFKTEVIDENATKVEKLSDGNIQVETDSGAKYIAKALIVATGASAKWLNLDSEQRLRGKGVSACATCDGFFFRDKVVAVVGGGDSAMEESTYLTKFASKVYVLVRKDRESMKASKIMQDRATSNPKIEFIFNTEVKEVLGESAVEGLLLSNTTTQEETKLDVQGLFLAIGHQPNTAFLSNQVTLKPNGYIQPSTDTKTNVEGIFVAGDVHDHKYRQAITAAGYGCMAALDVEKYLSEHVH